MKCVVRVIHGMRGEKAPETVALLDALVQEGILVYEELDYGELLAESTWQHARDKELFVGMRGRGPQAYLFAEGDLVIVLSTADSKEVKMFAEEWRRYGMLPPN